MKKEGTAVVGGGLERREFVELRKGMAIVLSMVLLLSILEGCGTTDTVEINGSAEEERTAVIEIGAFEEEEVVLLHSAEFLDCREAVLLFAEEVNRKTGGNVAVQIEAVGEDASGTLPSVFESLIEGTVSFAVVNLSDPLVLECLEENSIYYYNCVVLSRCSLDTAPSYGTDNEEISRFCEMLFVVNNDYWNSRCDDLKKIFLEAAKKAIELI